MTTSQLVQRQPSPLPPTPPTTQPNETQDDQVDQEVKVSKKRSRKSSTSKPAIKSKRKKITRSTEKAVGSENDIKIKQERSSSSLDVFNFDGDDDSEDVDELMPSKSSPKKTTSANKQKSAATNRPKRVTAETKGNKPTKTRNPWQPDEDRILIDEYFKEMPRPSWIKISKALDDRNANSCLSRWNIIVKRLYQNI